MLLTDGALSDYADAFTNGTLLFDPTRETTDLGDQIRVFTYLIGKDLKNSAPLRDMACNRRGYFAHIASPADVKENVMQYYHVMNRQLAKTDFTQVRGQISYQLIRSKKHSYDP